MARNPDLIRTLLDRPSDDIARLVYADWLDENGDPKHAELIRVQCELAQRKMVRDPNTKKLRKRETCVGLRRRALTKREKELLADPSFHLPGQRRLWYERGFAERFSLKIYSAGAELSPDDPRWKSDSEYFCHHVRATDVPVLDRMLRLSLYLPSLNTRGIKQGDPLTAACLRRVTSLKCDYAVAPVVLGDLQKCPHLDSVTSIRFQHSMRVRLDAIERLYLSTALPNVTEIDLVGGHWIVGDDTPAEDKHVAAFVTRIGAVEKADRLMYLQLNGPVGPKTARALLDAPHLHPSKRLGLPLNRGLDKAMKAALKKRFGKALKL